MERAQKLRKLQTLRADVPYVSKSALESILTWVQKNGPTELMTAKHMREATRATLAAAGTYGPVLVLKPVVMCDGSHKELPFLQFHSFVHAAYKAGGALFNILKDVAGPVGLVLYSDEVCPGNVLAASPARKCWVVYAGFVKAGRLLQNEKAWVTLCCLKSSTIQKAGAGMPQILKIILHMIFNAESVDVLDMGILLQGPQGCAAGYERKHLKLSFSFMVHDGAAHKMRWSLKGDAGSRFCGLCKNVFSHMADEEGMLNVSCWTSVSLLQLTSSMEVLASWERMAHRASNAGDKLLDVPFRTMLCWLMHL